MSADQTEPTRRNRQRGGVVRVRRTGLLRRRCEHGRWQLEPVASIGLQEALDDMRHRRESVGTFSGARVRQSGAVALYIPGRYQNAVFHGRLRQQADGGLEFAGAMRETLSAVVVPLVYTYMTLLTVALIVFGALAGVWPPLVIGVAGAPVSGTFTVYFHRGRARSYATESKRLWENLAGLLAPLNPRPLDAGTRELDAG
jgi:hypothetical protein